MASIEGFELSAKEKAMNLLRGAALPGVGAVTAERIADHFEGNLESVMNSNDAVLQLSQVHKIGKIKAERIKEAWDSTRGALTLSINSLVSLNMVSESANIVCSNKRMSLTSNV